MAAQGPEAYATLLVSDSYLPGALVLAHSLRDNGTRKLLVALVTLESVSGATVTELNTIYDQVIPVDRIVNKSPANLYLMNRPDLNSTFTKIALWRQTQFSRLVYIDADVVALRAPDELFSRSSTFAAAPDVGWPDCFNSGVMALTPNLGDYYALLALAQRGISFDGADQGLLNMHFGNYDRLSFSYNCTPSGHYQYVPAYRHFQSSISMVHFIGQDKPWFIGREAKGSTGVYEELLGRWWAVYDKHYRYPASTTTPTGKPRPNQSLVKQYVQGEQYVDYGYQTSYVPPSLDTRQTEPQQATGQQADQSTLNSQDLTQSSEQGHAAPSSSFQPRRFSAPQSDWDAVHHPPPTESKPEAANFPTHTYTMSNDRNLFQAPRSYPTPPNDMWYQVPSTPRVSERPKPLFPWEENQAPATRVFPQEPLSPEIEADLQRSPDSNSPPEPTPELSITTGGTSTGAPESPATPTIQVISPQPFSSYSRTNAWDDNPGIDRYVERMQAARKSRNQAVSGGTSPSQVSSPGFERRRPSMRLTDFPSSDERPSLPVTPAPLHRPSFWGSERDQAGELPAAEGVPSQQDWDPLKKLEELQRRQSEVLATGPIGQLKELPSRKLPDSAPLLPTSEETDVPQSSVGHASLDGTADSSSEGKVGAPSFSAVSFGTDGAHDGADEGVFSPIEA